MNSTRAGRRCTWAKPQKTGSSTTKKYPTVGIARSSVSISSPNTGTYLPTGRRTGFEGGGGGAAACVRDDPRRRRRRRGFDDSGRGERTRAAKGEGLSARDHRGTADTHPRRTADRTLATLSAIRSVLSTVPTDTPPRRTADRTLATRPLGHTLLDSSARRARGDDAREEEDELEPVDECVDREEAAVRARAEHGRHEVVERVAAQVEPLRHRVRRAPLGRDLPHTHTHTVSSLCRHCVVVSPHSVETPATQPKRARRRRHSDDTVCVCVCVCVAPEW